MTNPFHSKTQFELTEEDKEYYDKYILSSSLVEAELFDFKNDVRTNRENFDEIMTIALNVSRKNNLNGVSTYGCSTNSGLIRLVF